MPPTQTTRTNHLGYDVGASRKIPHGAVTPNALTRLALTLFRLLCFGFCVVKAALKAAAAIITTRPADRGGAPPAFQLQVKVEGATVMLDAGSAWTAADVKAALHAKTGRASGGYYLVASGGKPLDDGAATTLAALGVGPGDRLELRGRLRGGGPSQEDIRAAFALYDTNGDGLLSPDELKAIMCKPVSGGKTRTEAQVDALVRQFDTDGDGMLSMEEISKAWAELDLGTSYWDEVGDRKPNASVLKRALADTVLVDAAWLARLADAGDILPRCQDLPEGARVTLEEMEQWKDDHTVGVLVISYPWLDADHPDKDGLQLRAISHVLKLFDKHAKERYGAGCKVGVFLDYVSMPQRSRRSAEDDRTPEEKATFRRALQGINAWYGHPKTHVLLVDTDLPEGAHTNIQPYEGRGWCVMELNASGLVKDDTALISLEGLTGGETSLEQVRENGRAARAPPLSPAAFTSTLEAGVASGDTKFTNSGDVPLVGKIYGWAFAAEMGAVVVLSYFNLGWDDAQMLTLCEALRAAHAGGGLRKLESLDLRYNQIGDGAAAALAALLEEGAMPNLKVLELSSNQISNDGVAALASALRGGALPSCTSITLDYNPGSDAPVDEALRSPERAVALARNAAHMAAVVELDYSDQGWVDAQVLTLCEALRAAHADGGLRKLKKLDLRENQMGDRAAAALAALLEAGAMPNLEMLFLDNNQIADVGVAALASALRGGALPSCTEIDLHRNQIGDDGVAALASALRGGALPSCTRIELAGNPGSVDPVRKALASPEHAAAMIQNAAHMAAVVDLDYCSRGWDNAQVLTLCEALRAAHADGGLRKLKKLSLSGNRMGDGAAAALAALLKEGAMPNLKELNLGRNRISNDGVAALASALQDGALPACTTIYLNGNQISNVGVAALASALRGGALPSCTWIDLRHNQIADDGVAALASALRGGALPSCEYIILEYNKIADDGVAALASALRGGALPSCTSIDLVGNPGSGDPVKEALASPERAVALARNAAHMAAVVELKYWNWGLNDAQVRTLCEALRAAHAGGGLRKLERLFLCYNKMGDGAAAALAALLKEGAMPNLKKLDLMHNQIGNDGVAALASALRGGALPLCTMFVLFDNPGSRAPVDEALASPERAAALARRQAE